MRKRMGCGGGGDGGGGGGGSGKGDGKRVHVAPPTHLVLYSLKPKSRSTPIVSVLEPGTVQSLHTKGM